MFISQIIRKCMVFGLGLYMKRWGGVFKVRPAHPIYNFFELVSFPRVQRWQEPLVRVEDPKVELD